MRAKNHLLHHRLTHLFKWARVGSNPSQRINLSPARLFKRLHEPSSHTGSTHLGGSPFLSVGLVKTLRRVGLLEIVSMRKRVSSTRNRKQTKGQSAMCQLMQLTELPWPGLFTRLQSWRRLYVNCWFNSTEIIAVTLKTCRMLETSVHAKLNSLLVQITALVILGKE